MAPGASILLQVECNTPSNADMLHAGVNFSRTVPGVVAVSKSFGINGGFQTEGSFDRFFTTPVGHPGVTFLAATGDNGAPGGYPAESPNVLAVGGTTLNVDGLGDYISESGWRGGGGGISRFEGQPSFQAGTVFQSLTRRATPDVSLVADPATGVAIFDSYDFGSSTPWITVGGTSLSCPAWAGIVAVVDQARAITGINPLGGTDSIQEHLYRLSSSNFHDITSGNNGFPAGAGYDLVTGIGTPKINLLVGHLDTVPTLVFTVQPSTVLPHHPILPSVTVSLEDQFGTIETNANSNVTIAVGAGPGTLGGTLTVQLVDGVAIFSDLSLLTPGAYTLVVTDSASGVAATVSDALPACSLPGHPARLLHAAHNDYRRSDHRRSCHRLHRRCQRRRHHQR